MNNKNEALSKPLVLCRTKMLIRPRKYTYIPTVSFLIPDLYFIKCVYKMLFEGIANETKEKKKIA